MGLKGIDKALWSKIFRVSVLAINIVRTIAKIMINLSELLHCNLSFIIQGFLKHLGTFSFSINSIG